MKLPLALALSLAVVVCDDSKSFSSHQPQSDVQGRYGSAYPYNGNRRDRHYPGNGGNYPGNGGNYPGNGGNYPGSGGYPYPGGGGYPYPGNVYPYPGTGNPYVRPSGCKNWCRRDNNYPGYGRQRYDCCDHSAPVIYPRPPYQPYPNYNRQKVCPASPPVCLRAYSAAAPPTECYSDSECATTDRCCHDVCLQHKVCKTADYVEGATPYRPPRPYSPRRPHRGGRRGSVIGDLVGTLFGRSAGHGDATVFASDEPAGDVGHAQVRFADGEKKDHTPGSGVEAN